MKIVRDIVLVFQKPIDRRFVAHRLFDDLGSRFAVHVKEGLVIQIIDFCYRRIEPD
jgi:hypothetical protein